MKKKLFSYIELTDKVSIQKLSVSEQFRVLLNKIFESDDLEIKSDDAVYKEEMTLFADCYELIFKATEPIRKNKRHKVKLKISNKFDAVLSDVLRLKRFKDYYDYTIKEPKITYDVTYFKILYMEIKV